MTQAKAQAVVSVLISQGYTIQVQHDDATPANYTVIVTSDNPLAALAVSNFATAQGISATITQAVLS